MTARSTEPFPKPTIPTPPSAPSALRRGLDRFGVIALVVAALVWLSLEGGGYGPVQRHVAGVLVWAFLFGLLLRRGSAALPRGPVLAVAGAIAAFAAFTALSMLWSESVGRSYDETTRVLLYLGVFLVVAGAGAGRPQRRGQMLDGLTLGALVVVVLAVLSRLESSLFPVQQLQQLAPAFRPRLAYPFNYWNAVGSFVSVAIVLLLHAASRADRSARLRAAATAALPVAGLALYLTFSRGGVIVTAVACAIVLLLSPRRLAVFGSLAIAALGTLPLALLVRHYRPLNDGLLDQANARSQGHRVLVALVVVTALTYVARLLVERSTLPRRAATALTPHARKLAIAAAVLIALATAAAAPKIADKVSSFSDPVVFQGNATNRIESRLTSGSANGRVQFWESSWDAWKAGPVAGHGAGTWEFWWRRHGTITAPTRDSHSLFFDVLAELGTLGVIALVAMVGLGLWVCVAAARAATGAARPALVSIAAAAAAWTLGAATDWTWEMPAVTVMFFALVALAASERRDQTAPAVAEAGAPAREPLVGGLAVTAWIVVVLQGISLVAAWSLERSEKALARGDLRSAQTWAGRARDVQPWAAEAYMQLALVRVADFPDKEAIRLAKQAVDRERTNWRTWHVLVRVEAAGGRLSDASVHLETLRKLARQSALIPTYQELYEISIDKRRP